MEDATVYHEYNNEQIQMQYEVKMEEKMITKVINVEKFTEKYVEALYDQKMHNFAACWIGKGSEHGFRCFYLMQPSIKT